MQATRHAKLMYLVIGEDRRDALVVKFSNALGRRLHPWPRMRCRSRCRPRRRWRRPGLLTWCAPLPPPSSLPLRFWRGRVLEFFLMCAVTLRRGTHPGNFSGARRGAAARDSPWILVLVRAVALRRGTHSGNFSGARRDAAARGSFRAFVPVRAGWLRRGRGPSKQIGGVGLGATPRSRFDVVGHHEVRLGIWSGEVAESTSGRRAVGSAVA